MHTFNLSLQGLLDYLPALIGGIVTFVVTLFIAGFVSKLVSKFTVKRTKDHLIANFIGKIFWTLVFTIGVVLTLGILGLGTISNKILAAAGITTFVVGFAMKDIGENFLAGLMLAFGRPFRVGNMIECSGVKGAVKDMTMRQTTVETEDGRIVMIPNSLIIKNPLSVYTHTDILSDSFSLKVEAAQSARATHVIEQAVNASGLVSNDGEKITRALTDSITGEQAAIITTYWTDAQQHKTPRPEIRSKIIQLVMEALGREGIRFSG